MQDNPDYLQPGPGLHPSTDNVERRGGEAGFSLVELLVVLVVMLTISGSIISLTSSTFQTSANTFELADAQQGLRTNQEYLTRDLVEAGDGLLGIYSIRVPAAFVRNYLKVNPTVDAVDATLISSLPIIEDDDSVPANTLVRGTAVNVAAGTDRVTILTLDNNFTPAVSVAVGNIRRAANQITVIIPATDQARFAVGEIYAFTSQSGGAFGVISGIQNNAGVYSLILTNGDVYGINDSRTNGPIGLMAGIDGTGNSTSAASIIRIQMLHYYVDANGLLHRRIFGVSGGLAYRDSVLAEHVTNLQLRYTLMAGGALRPPANQFTAAEQSLVREVEVAVTAETVHALARNGLRANLTSTTSTSVRNLQFRGNSQLGP